MSGKNTSGLASAELTEALEHQSGQAPFTKPWELRVFAIAVAACEQNEFAWADFQEALTDAIKNWESAHPNYSQNEWSYYEHFVTALEVVLARHSQLSQEVVSQRARLILEMPAHHHHVARYDPITIDPARH